ncbi:MAG: site-specific integrase, partial [Clostridia bacterium]|nr:site-specific integrase [Clostridia bacterium]
MEKEKIMISKKNNPIKNDQSFSLDEVKTFLKATKGNMYEVYFKLILAYQFSRLELMSLEWQDIDFENDTITICP